MPTHYRLVSSGRPDLQADEIIVGRDEDGTEHTLSQHGARAIPEDHLAKARNLADLIGYKVVEVEVPEDEAKEGEDQSEDIEQRQEAGLDTQAQAQADETESQSSTAPQQGMQSAEAQTTTFPQ